MTLAIGAHHDRGLRAQHAIAAYDSRCSAKFPWAAAILDHAVRLDLDRIESLDHFHRLVGEVAAGIRNAEHAVGMAHRAPAAGERLGEDVALAVVPSAEGREGNAAFAGCTDALRRDLREDAHQRVDRPPADDGAR